MINQPGQNYNFNNYKDRKAPMPGWGKGSAAPPFWKALSVTLIRDRLYRSRGF